MNTTQVKWVAELSHVREVSLAGTANLSYWRDRLAEEHLIPSEIDGRAQVVIVAAAGRFKGVSFQELSFSIRVSPRETGIKRHEFYLVQAFNSCRFFAYCERRLFATPYSHGDVYLSTAMPAAIQLAHNRESIFQAEMSGGAAETSQREPSRSGEESWEGAVFLPACRRRNHRPGRLFFAHVRGYTSTYPFLDSADLCSIRAASGTAICEALIASRFAATQWTIREDATHAKSKTYTQDDC